MAETGINIQQGKITLSADNTIIDGDLILTGYIYQKFRRVADSDAIPIGEVNLLGNGKDEDGNLIVLNTLDGYKLNKNLYVNCTEKAICLPMDPAYEGARVVILHDNFVASRTAVQPTIIYCENNAPIYSGLFADDEIENIRNLYYTDQIAIESGTVELIMTNVKDGTDRMAWILLNNAASSLCYRYANYWIKYKYNHSGDQLVGA